jgi:hypothetical protein
LRFRVKGLRFRVKGLEFRIRSDNMFENMRIGSSMV